MTLGAERVRLSFNPSADPSVDKIKDVAAGIIDIMHDLHLTNADPELRRLCALAMTAFEEGAMWAVKALTTQAPASPDSEAPLA